MEKLLSHEELKKIALSDPEVAAEYNRLKPEFELLNAMLSARKDSGLTQEQIAEKMGTTQSSVARMESRLGNGTLPSLSMLQRYADAVGKQLRIQIV